MPKAYLWALDQSGEVFYLSSWDNRWQKAICSAGKVRRFKAISSNLWSTWCIGLDNQIYLYVPTPEIKIRTTDTMIENQRRDFGRYCGKNLKSQDPSEFAASNYYGKLIKSDLKIFPLPSTRWKWEDVWKIKKSFNGEMTEDGWTYSSGFTQKFQIHQHRLSSCVRRRFWQRYRYFHASERWLLIAQDNDPFEITCNQECGNYLDVGVECIDYSNLGIIDIGCGGEMLPHQKDGFVSVWTINESGEVLYRLEVHRQNPEGSHWCLVKLPKYSKGSCLSVGPLGHLLVYCSQGVIYFRENISWKNPIGSSWISIDPPENLLDGEIMIQFSMSVYAIWARSNKNRLWFREDVNMHEPNSHLAIGKGWTFAAYNVTWICSSPSGQLWSLPMNGSGLFYRFSKSHLNKTDRFWSGFVQLDFGFGEQINAPHLVNISANGLFIEDDRIPPVWLQSPVSHRTLLTRSILEDAGWRIKIMNSLVTRDYLEFKNPAFSNYTSLSEQVSWSKASNCQAKTLSIAYRWLPANVVLHHKLKEGKTMATMHVNIAKIGKSNHDIISFLESDEIACVSKFLPIPKGNVVERCTMLSVFIRKEDSLYYKNNDQKIIPRLLLKFFTEVEVEEWISALNLVMRDNKRAYSDKMVSGKIWFLNQFYEPFYVNSSCNGMHLYRCYQNGGHFKMIESCAKGRITWGLGFNGIAWAHSNGWGGSYLGLICSSKEDLHTTFDTKPIYAFEFEKLKLMPGNAFGTFSQYMWTDEFGNTIRNMDVLTLASRRWQWCGHWAVDHGLDDGDCDSDGWQYSTSITHKFDSNLTWTKSFRRRRWIRYYKTSTIGPWKEVLNDLIKITDLSMSPEYSCGVSDNYKCVVWAVTDSGRLLRRRGVTVSCPEGFEWLHIRTDLKIVSVSINKEGDLWVVCTHGSIWRLRQAANKDVARVNSNDWQVIKHANNEGKFITVSSGDRFSLWAIDSNYHLWSRMFSDLSNPSVGNQWIHVCDQVTHVSSASQLKVFVLFATGSLAERVGISTKLPQGTGWRYEIDSIATHVSTRGA